MFTQFYKLQKAALFLIKRFECFVCEVNLFKTYL